MNSVRRLALFCVAIPAVVLSSTGCGTPGQDLRVQVESAPVVSGRIQTGAEVGRLLSPDPETSHQAERRLEALTGEALERFLAYARSLEGEHDMRLLSVLDEHHALPELTTDETLEFLLWKAQRSERSYVIKAMNHLTDMARTDPAPLVARLRRGGSEVDILGVVLAMTRTLEAVPPLIDRYRHTTDARSRVAAAEALATFAGEEHRPRSAGRAQDINRDADALAAWYVAQMEMKADARGPEAAPLQPPPKAPTEERR